MNSGTSVEVAGSIPGRRTKKGRHHSLAIMLVISIAKILCGANDLRPIRRWGRRLSFKVLAALGVELKRKTNLVPCDLSLCFLGQCHR
jgi:hypothetical protein